MNDNHGKNSSILIGVFMGLHINKFREEPLKHDPFEYMVLNDFVNQAALTAARQSFPKVPGPGSHPPSILNIEGGFLDLMNELQGPEFRAAVEEKFKIDLSNRPTMYTVRGFCRKSDGKIHPDSKTKIITVLLYLNDNDWPDDGGRLRILRNGTDLENYVDEVTPKGGTLVVFRRADNSWHGHHPFEGKRRAIQLNWVTDQSVVQHEQGRHGVSARVKAFFGGYQ
jgi:SM-20-related protein